MLEHSEFRLRPRRGSFTVRYRTGTLIAFAVAMAISATAMAANFGPVRYDPSGNQLIVTMLYQGTTPNHHFSIQWGPCRKLNDQLHGPGHQIIDLGVLDDQGNDAAINSYTEVVRVSLAGLSCRPATVTLWTPPHFTTGIDIP